MKSILIVDDSLTSRLYVKKCVQMVFHERVGEIFEARDGEQGLTILREHSIDLILSDVNMPVMGGFTFLRNIKSNPNWVDIPVIFITSLANISRNDNLLELGATAVVKKPINPSELGEILAQQFGNEAPEEDAEGWG